VSAVTTSPANTFVLRNYAVLLRAAIVATENVKQSTLFANGLDMVCVEFPMVVLLCVIQSQYNAPVVSMLPVPAIYQLTGEMPVVLGNVQPTPVAISSAVLGPSLGKFSTAPCAGFLFVVIIIIIVVIYVLVGLLIFLFICWRI
jgi:hypothetical protein